MPAIVLHGDLERFGGPYVWDVASPQEAVRALCRQIKGFRQRLREGSFTIRRVSALGPRDLGLSALGVRLKETHELHIEPVAQGSNSGNGTTKAILGVALIAASFAFAPAVVGALGPTMGMASTAFSIGGLSVTWAQIAGFGAVMMLQGVSQLFSSGTAGGATTADTNASTLFSGPVNVTEQGVPVPLVYGEYICGSVVISSDITAEQE